MAATYNHKHGFWVQIGKRKYCHYGIHSTCFHARLRDAPGLDRYIRAATKEINGILFELEKQHAGPNRALAFLVVHDEVGDDVLMLDWVYPNVEVKTAFDGRFLTSASPD